MTGFKHIIKMALRTKFTAFLDGHLAVRHPLDKGGTGGAGAMTKSELTERLAALNPHLYQRDVECIVAAIFDEISRALSQGERVELRGFGAFAVKRRKARAGRNPRSGVNVYVPEKHVPFFKTGEQRRERLKQVSSLARARHNGARSSRRTLESAGHVKVAS